MSTKILSMPFFCFWQIGMLGGDHSVCSTCCCLLQVVGVFPMFTFCFNEGACSLCGPLATRPQFFFTFSSAIPSHRRCTRYRSFSRCRSKILGFALSIATLEMATSLVIQLGDFAATNCFHSSFHRSKNKTNALVLSVVRQFMTSENLFLDFATCSWICMPTTAISVSRVHNGNTSCTVLRL